MSDTIELKKVHLKLSEDAGVVVFYRNQYGFEADMKVDKETSASARLTQEGVYWGSYYLPFKELTLTHPVATPRVIGVDRVPKDALHFVYELVAEIFMSRLTDGQIDFDALNEKYQKCLNGISSRDIYRQIPRVR